ncbi:hypothetical protein F511_42852 [Dorcoceras hygrometricum]|uniref:Dystroglycan-like n=1 Tax=Dorcoceras hygrometricum TaxID=472368 RepID=A0A2Z7CQ09_9LAMI|nr:hypothetical protein F511_42852 [Dorcoceras hygrometricum]
MVSMFQALIAYGLQVFLGCSAVIHEEALLEFFANGTVRDGLVVSTVHGVTVEISERLFAEMFELPVEGLTDLTDVPKDKIFDAKSIVSLTGEPVRTSGTKSQMKIHFRLLCDIMAKYISVKAGSFNAITVEKFAMVTAVVRKVKVNWSSVLFTILKNMVTEGTRQAKGFAIQISLLLENVPNMELGESSEFPSSKMLTERTIHRYIVLNDKAGAQEAADVPPVKKASRKPAASKKRPAVAAAEEPVPKKKRTSKKKSGSSPSTLEIVVVAQEAVPIQMFGPSTGVPATEEPVEQPAAEDDISADQPVDEVAGETDGDESAADKDFSLFDDPDTVINQVLNQLDSISDDKDDKQSDRAETWFDRAFDEMLRNDSPVVTPSDTDEEPFENITKCCKPAAAFAWIVVEILGVHFERGSVTGINSVDVSDFVSSIALERTALRSLQMAGSPILVSPNSVSVAPVLQMLDEPSSSESSSDDISMNFADQDTAATTSAPNPDITEALNQLQASIDQICERDDGAKHRDTLLLHLHNFEKQVIARLDAQDRVLGALRRDSNDQRNLLSLELQSTHKQLGTQIVITGLDVVDVRRVVRESHQELNARINSLDEQVAATRNDLLEFSAQAQQTLNIITNQLSELVAYINRGGDNKKGESSSSRGLQPPPPPVDQIRGTGANVSSPDFSQRVEMAQRNITERVLDADRRESLLQAERDRERRRRELSGSKRRRRH